MWQVTSLVLTGQLYLTFITLFLSGLVQDHRPLSGRDVLQGGLVAAAIVLLHPAWPADTVHSVPADPWYPAIGQ